MPFVEINIDAIIKKEEVKMKNTLKQVLESQLKGVQARVTEHLEVYEALINEQASLEAQLVTAQHAPSAQEALEKELSELTESCMGVSFEIVRSITVAACLDCESFPIKIGIAKCDPTDEYNETIGKLIALKRALGMHVNASNYGKEKVVKSCGNCIFIGLSSSVYPCNSCFGQKGYNTYWEPMLEEAPVLAEPVKPDYTGMKDFGKCRSCSHDLDVNVEDYCKACVTKNMNGDDWEPAVAAIITPPDYSSFEGFGLCNECAHREKSGSAEPCRDCLSTGGKAKWEPAIPIVKATDYTASPRYGYCIACAHMLESVVCAPCDKCKHLNETEQNDAWTPPGTQQ